jgi:hypothetical protein
VKRRYEALEAAASDGELGASLSYSRKLDHKAVVSLPDLIGFLKHAGPDWDWLRSFATRWQRHSRKSVVRKKRTTDPEQETRDQIALVLRLGRELQRIKPAINRREIIDQIAESGKSNSAKRRSERLFMGPIPK